MFSCHVVVEGVLDGGAPAGVTLSSLAQRRVRVQGGWWVVLARWVKAGELPRLGACMHLRGPWGGRMRTDGRTGQVQLGGGQAAVGPKLGPPTWLQ